MGINGSWFCVGKVRGSRKVCLTHERYEGKTADVVVCGRVLQSSLGRHIELDTRLYRAI